MELRNIKTFIHVAETNSFTVAALRENYAQSTVTQQIQMLERELGASLFIRAGRRITLSSAGRAFLPYAYRMAALEQETLMQFCSTGEPEGEFFLGIIETIATSRYMQRVGMFLRKYPKVRLHVANDTAPHLRKALVHGDIDIAILFDPYQEGDSLRVLHRSPSPVEFIAATDSPFAHRPVQLHELVDSTWVLTQRGTNYRKKLEEDLAERGLYLRDRVEIGTSKTIIDFVAAGLGLSILPAVAVADAVCEGRIAVVHVEDYEIAMQLQILAAGERWLPHPLALLAEDFAAGLEEEG